MKTMVTPDYISRKALLQDIEKYIGGEESRACFSHWVQVQPAADVKPVVRASWYGSGDGYADGHLVIDEWECPCCGKYFPEWDEKPDWNFCPNCGADMRSPELT